MLFKKKRAIHRGMRKAHGLKIIHYVARLVDLKEHLDVFPGAKISENIYAAELDEHLLNSMPNSLSKQAYLQGFYFESITLKAAVNMFKLM